jgi:hypothetical protein
LQSNMGRVSSSESIEGGGSTGTQRSSDSKDSAGVHPPVHVHVDPSSESSLDLVRRSVLRTSSLAEDSTPE